MTITKLPSGSYRIRQTYNSKTYSVVVPYKPGKKEAQILILNKMEELPDTRTQNAQGGNFEYYAEKFLSDNKKALSSSTYVNYKSVLRNISTDFKRLPFYDITEDDIRKEIKRYSTSGKNGERSPKTVKNCCGFVRCVFASYRDNFRFSVEISKSKQKYEYEPTTKDVEHILEEAEGTPYEIPLRLACLGLRRGEILALTIKDLDSDNVLTINKAMAITEDNTFAVKKPKTEESNRRIPIPASLADKIRAQGYVYKGAEGQINKYLHSIQRRLGIPSFRLHVLRHFAAAYLHKEGFTEEQVMAWCGWSTSETMNRVYRYNLDPAESQKNMAASFGSLFK